MPISDIKEIRIMPPLAIGRFGSSPEPMDNYILGSTNSEGHRQLVNAETIYIKDGRVDKIEKPSGLEVNFTDSQRRVRPVAPFFEVWARFDGSDKLRPLEIQDLDGGSLEWAISLGNLKAYRRTNNPDDAVTVEVEGISNHEIHSLKGVAANFLADTSTPLGKKFIPFGDVIFIEPTTEFPQIRLRFIPPAGNVYGFDKLETPDRDPTKPDLEVVTPERVVYDISAGDWHQYTEGSSGRPITNPGGIFRAGFFDDSSDGIIKAKIIAPNITLEALARITVGPPDFVPDSLSVRTIADELEQILEGPSVSGAVDKDHLVEILQRAVDTVRHMNVNVMNQYGMARHDAQSGRDDEPIVSGNPDTLEFVGRHKVWLDQLRSGDYSSLPMLMFFLRTYEKVGDLSSSARRKMPALMRGSDGRHLALTQRQLNKIKSAIANGTASSPQSSTPVMELVPKNLAAQVNYKASGNPPSSRLDSTIANCFPGLEFDFRNLWRKVFEGIELHESDNIVVDATNPNLNDLVRHVLIAVRLKDTPVDKAVRVQVPMSGPGLLPGAVTNLEWTNSLASIIEMGKNTDNPIVTCTFERPRPFLISSSGAAQGYQEYGVRDYSSNTTWITPPRQTMQSEYLILNMGAERAIKAIELFPGDVVDLDNGSQLDLFNVFPVRFQFEVSTDQQNWTTVQNVSNHVPIRGQWSRWEFAETTVVFLRIRILETRRISPTGPFISAIAEWRFDEANKETIEKHIPLRQLFYNNAQGSQAAISEKLALPGELTQGLCSPWQQDYRECGCQYWAASRPDYVDLDPVQSGVPSKGYNWLDIKRNDPNTSKEYILDGSPQSSDRLISYFEMYVEWENHLKFVIGGESK
ncbi:MAG: hypothetical protein GY941_16825 [Planctomycetes bacterium]|nr:hypothetical protein [Planctomycetota bacterium]